jgi:large subunit ribosomal protein L29
MKTKEIKKLSLDQLKKKVDTVKKDLFNFRFRKVNGQVTDSAKISILKKDIAKVLTQLKVKNK